jgi:hypothetical protein
MIKRTLLIIAAALSLSACFTDPQNTNRVLTEAGYSHIQITGFRFYGCDKNDSIHTGFKAVGPTGHPVTGVVCSGYGLFGKSNTIRID